MEQFLILLTSLTPFSAFNNRQNLRQVTQYFFVFGSLMAKSSSESGSIILTLILPLLSSYRWFSMFWINVMFLIRRTEADYFIYELSLFAIQKDFLL